MKINLANQVKINFNKDTQLSLFKDALMKSEGNSVSNVQFYSITGSRLPLSEQVTDLKEYPVLLQINNDKTFALNFSDQFKVNRDESRDIKHEEHYFDFAKGVGLRGYEKFFFPNFAHRLQHALPMHKELLSSQEVIDSLGLTLRYYSDKGHDRNDMEKAKLPI